MAKVACLAMDVGIALPTMARGFTRATFVDWCRGIDEGPFSSVSAGERLTFHNPELLVTNAAAAALTERVAVITNLTVLPLHSTAVIAKQLATLDVLSGGRLVVGVGVGGREHDYRAAGMPFDQRHQRLDRAVAELRRLWSGEPPFDGADPIGPAPVRPGGPTILAGALGLAPSSGRRAGRTASRASRSPRAASRSSGRTGPRRPPGTRRGAGLGPAF